jgi:hypothetical protein
MKLRLCAAIAVCTSFIFVAGACSGSSDSASESTVAPTTVAPTTAAPEITAAPTTAAPTTTAAPATTAVPAPAATAIMPDVVCMNLQAAQNKIQENGVFYSDSFDATGEGRMQINDSNWIVVSQTPAPGSPITEGSANLGAVKEGEPNPC